MRKLFITFAAVLTLLSCCCAVGFANTEMDCSHNYFTTYIMEPTCEQDGMEYKTCQWCGDEVETTIPAIGHAFGEGYYADFSHEVRCERDGLLTKKCQNAGCYKKITQTVPATGHTFGEWRMDIEPTCSKSGRNIQDCQNEYCWEQNYETIPAIGHAFGPWGYKYEWQRPDCETEGTLTRVCQREGCSAWENQKASALGHDYRKSVKKAKKGSDGNSKKVCTICNDWEDYTAISAPNKIKLSSTAYTYNGKQRKPVVKVYNKNGSLISAKHYKVTYQKGRKNVGKYTVTVTFKSSSEKYTGKMTTSFKINPKPTSITSFTKGTETFTVKWKKVSSQVSGYQIRYSDYSDLSWGANYKTVKSFKTTKKKISNLWEDEKYYVQIRTYKIVNGKKYYSAWSKKKTVRTKAKPTYSSSSSDDDDGDSYYGTVYYTRTGECYHTHKCGNGTYMPTSLSTAISWGLRACQKCF